MESYATCVGGVANAEWKGFLGSLTPAVMHASAKFEEAVKQTSVHCLSGDDFRFGPSGNDELDETVNKEVRKLYTQRMVRRGTASRVIYDQIFLATDCCPLCGHREVSTLDHHLPKVGFPYLSVTPSNLVPACIECNKVKLDRIADIAEEETLHPYFDDLQDLRWLRGSVVEESPPAVLFYVDSPTSWSAVLAERVKTHFAAFRLARLYGAQAATQLRAIELYLEKISQGSGSAGVSSYLADMAVSSMKVDQNYWMVAMYESLAESSWYCSGGYRFDL
ncbi:HNH endonuclease [Amycolatopsis sp. NBC_01480]|uniref:HNH endonuclease n=1 Tax=Amycolatopsis sp. NBC_01480 TaxID=2903562 RepID=UPI002E2A3E90|nr:hypothetical protein [Amycolatopsis sp. NBC_01480]